MWGFTVDDALISVRYARHLAAGLGWRFDAGAASTDGVTPLPWPLILVPMARTGDALAVLGRSKLLGLALWILTGVLLGDRIGRVRGAPVWARGAILASVALSVPLAAHAVSGMETALATFLATYAAIGSRRPLVAAVSAGLAASLRPEMAPWACALAAGLSVASRGGVARAVLAGGAALTPFTICASIRAWVWGRPAPLAIWAKPSDLNHGMAYVGAALVVCVVPILVAAPWALRRAPRAMAIVVAAAVHVVAIAIVGGDWMPYARLLVPIATVGGVCGGARQRPMRVVHDRGALPGDLRRFGVCVSFRTAAKDAALGRIARHSSRLLVRACMALLRALALFALGEGEELARVSRTLPSRSTLERTFTSTASPSFITSVTFSTRCAPSPRCGAARRSPA
jgi:hypothetical protein